MKKAQKWKSKADFLEKIFNFFISNSVIFYLIIILFINKVNTKNEYFPRFVPAQQNRPRFFVESDTVFSPGGAYPRIRPSPRG
ncbi:hypothetical protein [Anaerotruncus massiliensis (ex Togo et al. 2019)]|uniref:Uncharacterized protein n=1 Tax=Anaerotruncus massiliensis (ex Togo et al. 2019) TaxID=1673720 RepID=A0ABR7AFH9_9FIRM|nr:hypothetical protein [Anaerotruncus massiliensis (ex Togo et al. 2019)]MBC3939062.1 hypothetical protein [Anaerotruncus massiliensis (ex Togo et al. 2019)]